MHIYIPYVIIVFILKTYVIPFMLRAYLVSSYSAVTRTMFY